MIKNKFLVTSLIALTSVFVPILAQAAYNDVSLGTSAIITINNPLGGAVSLTVDGSADVIESIVIGSTSFSVTLQSGSTLTVSSAGRNLITTDAPAANVSISCGDSSSSMTLTATAAVTVSVSVSANACGAAAASSSGSGGSNGPVAQSGGGGGGSYIAPSPTAVPTVATTPGTSSGSSSVTVASFANVNLGSRSSAVKTLQQILNSDPDTQVGSSGAGSPGNETDFFGPATKKAVQKFQVKYGISSPSKSDYGVFGPKTKAKLSEVSKLKGLGGAMTSSAQGSTSDIAKQISDALKAVEALQAQLKALK